MEFDPDRNVYTSNGPKARAEQAESDVQALQRRVAALEDAVQELQDRL